MKRVLSALVLGILTVLLVLWAPYSLAALIVSLVVLAAAHEMSGLLEAAGNGPGRLPALAASLLALGGAWLGGVNGLSAGLGAGLVLIFGGALAAGPGTGNLQKLAGGLFLLLFPVWSLAHLGFFLRSDAGRRSLLFLLLCVWVCDSAAFYVGSTLGRRKLAPRISPNKTVEGGLGGLMGALATGLVLKAFAFVPWTFPFTVVASLGIAVVAMTGDLAESLIKRNAGVKDSGSLIPGHGGILDRVDALLFSVPLFYYLLAFAGGLL